jgi:N-acetylmuramoyl-L-alanine amidase CwlA
MVALNYEVKHIRKNPYSRSGDPLIRLQAIVIHYTANPGGDADMHYRYFNTLSGRYAGAHIFVDRNKALELIPLNEVAYHANERKAGPLLSALKASTSYYRGGNANLLTVGIEICLEKDGSIHPDTLERTRLVVKELQRKYSQLRDTQNRVVRHYDITGKNCPKPFVESSAKWNAFLKSIDEPVKVEAKPTAPAPKEEEEMIKKAVVINSEVDELAGKLLAEEKGCGLYTRKSLAKQTQEINELMVVGGSADGLKAQRIIDLGGKDRWDTINKVRSYLGK